MNRLKISRTLIVAVIVVAVAGGGLVAYSFLSAPGPSCTPTWNCAAQYPLQTGGTPGVAGQQCEVNSTSVYCIGGVDAGGGPRNEIFTASVSASGNITGWRQDDNGYPQDVTGQACVTSSRYLYCVGGIRNDAGDDLAASYFTQLYANGSLGVWQPTTSYPFPVDSESCIAWSSHMYCVGGNNETDGTESTVAPSSSVWYSSLNSSGIGKWAESTSYPSGIFVPACFGADGFAYCIGGSDSNGDPLGTAYFAPLTANGVGKWALTTPYPVSAAGQSCVIASGYIYCVGGETAGGEPPSFTSVVFAASISGSGIGPWKQETGYPRTVGTSCVAADGNIYCIGGFDESTVGEDSIVNYASLTSLSG